jgi:uncharacterized protein YqjF (DUF2071 family)
MRRPFLTAEWRNLFLATYAVPPELLQPRLPAGLELDHYQGQACVSLVAFQFCNTRVLGISWPGYRNFAELNLRCYVRQGSQRGVVFIREFVPARLVAWIARFLYNEPYRAAPLAAVAKEEPDSIRMEYQLPWGGRAHRIAVTGNKPAFLPTETSTEHFFKEHHWGFGKTRGGQALRYEVAHPVWEVFPIRSVDIDLDWASVYGPEWGFLAGSTPLSTVLAVGSAIQVYPHGRLTTPAGPDGGSSGSLSPSAGPQ